MLAHQRIIRGIAEGREVLARLALLAIGVKQLGKQHRMRRIGNDRARDAAVRHAAIGHAPGDRAAPVVTDDGESLDPQRIGEQEHIAHQLVGRIGFHLLRLGRPAIAALVGRDAAKPVGEMRDLVAPGAVAFGKAVQEDQHGRIARAFVHHIEFDAVRQHHALLLQRHAQLSAFILSIYPAATIPATWSSS